LLSEGPIKKTKQPVEWYGCDGALCHWRVVHDHFWLVYESVTPVARVHRLPLDKISIPIDDFIGGRIDMDWILVPLTALANRHVERYPFGGLTPPSYATKDGHYDVLPDDKDEIYVFFSWRGEIRVWRGFMRLVDLGAAKKQMVLRGEQPCIKWDNAIYPKVEGKTVAEIEKECAAEDARPVLRVRSDMREAFLAYQDKSHFFFVTVSGKLYACHKRGANQHTELLWNDTRSPIRAVIHDTASQKTFVFTRASQRADKEGHYVFFELAPKIKSFAYDPKTIPEFKPDDPLDTMMEYARILLKSKQIKLSSGKGSREP
jgi:hypothetical protein